MTQKSHAAPRIITAHEFRVHEQLDSAARCIAISCCVFLYPFVCLLHVHVSRRTFSDLAVKTVAYIAIVSVTLSRNAIKFSGNATRKVISAPYVCVHVYHVVTPITHDRPHGNKPPLVGETKTLDR